VKRQTGVWIDAGVWDAYRMVCDGEKLRVAEPIEEYLRLVVQNGSALRVLNVVRNVVKARSEGLEDYARVLLDWHRKGQCWVHVTDENEVSVEHLLLDVLKDIANPVLRKMIREEMTKSRRQPKENLIEKGETEPVDTKEPSNVPTQNVHTASDRIIDMKKQLADHKLNAEQRQKFLEKIREIREKLRNDDKDRRKKGSQKWHH
jgi:hypothetical protein